MVRSTEESNDKPKKISEKKINSRIEELIEQNILLRKDGLEKLWRKIFEEFPQNRPNKKIFKRRISRLIWGKKEIDKTLQGIIGETGYTRLDPVEEFRRIYPYIPAEIVEQRVKWYKGLVSGVSKKLMGKDLPGIGRIDLSGGMPGFKMPKTAFKSPLKIETKYPDNFSLMFLNGANLGIKYPDIVSNTARRALSDAQQHKDDAVILTNIICLELKKAAGAAKVARAQIFGDNVKLDLIKDPVYRQVVRRILDEFPMDEIIYRTPEELLNDILGGWNKICTRPNRKPEYTGPIYIILGMGEKALIAAVTYWEIRWWTKKKQDELNSKIGILNAAIKAASKRLNRFEEEDEYEEETEGEYANIQKLNKKLDSLKHQLSRTTMSEVANQEFQRFYEHARGVIIQKIEQAIPNSKVIGQSTGFVQIGDKKGEINIPPHLQVTDSLLHDYVRRYGPKALRGELADFAVICHPWALQFRETARESDKDGERGSMKVFVAPTAIDDVFLRSKIDPSSVKDHPLVKAIYNETFKGGVLRVRCTNGGINADEISIGALEAFKNYPVIRKSSPRYEKIYARGSQYIYTMCGSDDHFGGRSREYFFDKNKKIRVGVVEAVFEMMRREGLAEGENMPVHIFASPDDQAHGQNIEYWKRPHPNQVSYGLIERITGEYLAEAERARSRKKILAMAGKIRDLSLYQFEKRGADYLLEQMMQVMERHIEPNLDIFSAILRRAEKAELIIKGIGEIIIPEYGGYDTRNIGAINIGSGSSHFGKTVDFALTEGAFYAQRLRDLLGGLKEWTGRKDLLKRLVVAPIYGSTSIGWGIIYVKGKHGYGFEMRESPVKQGWTDPLRDHVMRDLKRGNYSLIFSEKLPIIKVFGHKHFLSVVSTSYAVNQLSPAGVHTDEYGEIGSFPPNNTGVSFIGVPVDGPDSGPIIWRALLFDQIKDYIEDNPRPFDWERFLPNPA